MSPSRVAVVTGCSRGVGLALVSELAKHNYQVFATCRSPSTATQLTKLLTSLGQPAATPLDVTDNGSIQEAYKTVQKSTQRVDLLINNAGIATKNHPIDHSLEADPEEMVHLFRTNVAGVVRTTQVFMPLLRASQRPRVLNITSGLGSITKCALPNNPGMGAGRVISYRASKAALNMATVVMAQETPEVEFVLIHPGWVATDMGSSGGRSADITSETSAAGIVAIATEEQKRTAVFLDYLGNTLPW